MQVESAGKSEDEDIEMKDDKADSNEDGATPSCSQQVTIYSINQIYQIWWKKHIFCFGKTMPTEGFCNKNKKK